MKGVLVRKWYFSINHMLILPYNISTHYPPILNKMVIWRPCLKEFLMRCIKKFIIYIWTLIQPYKMKTYLKKIVEEMNIKIDLQRIIGWDLWKINKHYMQFPTKKASKCDICPTHDKIIYHKKNYGFFLGTPILTWK